MLKKIEKTFLLTLKSQTSKNRGYITFVLIGIALFAFLLASGFINSVNPPYDGTKYILVTPTNGPTHATLQLKTLSFISIPPAPTTVLSPTPTTVPFDCGAGISSLLQRFGVKREPENVYNEYPPSGQPVSAGGKIEFWYHDEHAMTLGSGPTTPQMVNHPVDSVFPTQNGVGVGDQTVKDPAGFYVFPALYLLDLTLNPNGQPIDAVNAGNPHIPDAVYGTWKQYNTGSDPQANQSQLPSGADPFPAEGSIQCTSGGDCQYGSEVVFNVNSLGLTATHTYLGVYTIHDGDNSSNGSDIGTACLTIQN